MNPDGNSAIGVTLGALVIIAMMPAMIATAPPATHNQSPMPIEMETYALRLPGRGAPVSALAASSTMPSFPAVAL